VGEAREFAILLGLVILLAIADTIAGQPLAARATCSLREPRGAELYPELSRVEFGAPENGIVLLASTLAWRLPLADAVAHRIAVAECERELAALGSTGNVAMRVRNALPNGDGFRSLEELAKCLHFSARSLKRRLASEGTSYREIVDDLRRQNALLSLADVGTTIEEVGARLGYSDTQSFVRAFRRWTDMTPSAYRAKRRFSERRGT
jgi:AraC-like DNA-binding protein